MRGSLMSGVTEIGLRPEDYGTHSLRRTKASIIYKQTGNLRAVPILLGHTTIESTVRYLGVDVEDALALAKARRYNVSVPRRPRRGTSCHPIGLAELRPYQSLSLKVRLSEAGITQAMSSGGRGALRSIRRETSDKTVGTRNDLQIACAQLVTHHAAREPQQMQKQNSWAASPQAALYVGRQ